MQGGGHFTRYPTIRVSPVWMLDEEARVAARWGKGLQRLRVLTDSLHDATASLHPDPGYGPWPL